MAATFKVQAIHIAISSWTFLTFSLEKVCRLWASEFEVRKQAIQIWIPITFRNLLCFSMIRKTILHLNSRPAFNWYYFQPWIPNFGKPFEQLVHPQSFSGRHHNPPKFAYSQKTRRLIFLVSKKQFFLCFEIFLFGFQSSESMSTQIFGREFGLVWTGKPPYRFHRFPKRTDFQSSM